MDVVIIPCPNCDHELRLPDLSLLGRFGRCPSCRHKFVLEVPNDRLAETGEFIPSQADSGLVVESHSPNAGETLPMNTADSVPDDEAERPLPQQIGRYKIKQRLGQGAMGAVYLAFDSQLHRDVALKVPKFTEADGKEHVERFYREARLAATLSHPSICPVYDIGEADGTRYIAMAYIKGRPLSDFISRDKPQPLKHIAKAICRVAMAVQEAHERGVVHRDLKPDNIMIDEHRKPVIMDFGLARRLFKSGEERLTHSGAMVGSPAYMSPEQIEGDPSRITAASDIYSLGVVLYELMTGVRPFRGSIGVVMGEILRDPPRFPSELRPDVDAAIESICLKMMAKQPEDRYASMNAVAHALAAYLRGAQTGADQPMPTIDLRAFRPQSLEELKAEQQAKRARPPGADRADSVSNESDHSPAPRANAAACRRARKLIGSHDYDQAVDLLRQAPQAERDAEMAGLLNQALDGRSLVKSLIADVNRARRNRDYYGMCRKLQRLLEVKPEHEQARQLLRDLQQQGFSGIAGEQSAERQTAEWVLDKGGTVDALVDGEPICNVESILALPMAGFRVISVVLNGCDAIDDDELAHLAGLSEVQTLSLSQTDVTDAGLRHLCGLTGLTSLLLSRTRLSGAGLKYLNGMSRLVKLELAETEVGDAGLACLEPLETLEFLGLRGAPVTDASAPHLARFSGLAFLDLYDTRFTATGVRQVATSLPNCRINY